MTSIKFHSILKEFPTDDAQVIFEIGYCVPPANRQTGKYERKQTHMSVVLRWCVCLRICICLCICVYICIKSNFNCAYLSLGKYLQRSLATAFDWASISIAIDGSSLPAETGQNALATRNLRPSHTHTRWANKHYEQTGKQTNKPTAKKIQLIYSPTKKIKKKGEMDKLSF